LILICLAVLVSSCGGPTPVVPPGPIARVNGSAISAADVNRSIAFAESVNAVSYPAGDSARCRAGSRAACGVLRRQALFRLIEQRLVLSYARTHHIVLDSADEAAVNDALSSLTAPHSPGTQFAHGLRRAQLRRVLETQRLIEKVERAIASIRPAGQELHIEEFILPWPAGTERRNVFQEITRTSGGSSPPSGTAVLTEWLPAFRLGPTIRPSVLSAARGDFVGPFRRGTSVIIIRVLGHGTHTYGAMARHLLIARAFSEWLARTVRHARLWCSPAFRQICGPFRMKIE